MTDYSRGILKQIEDLTESNEGLKQENKNLKAENRELRKEQKRLEDTLEDRIAKALERALTPLNERIGSLEAENARKDAEISRLKAQINKNSSNSSKPPSGDGFKKIPNSREPSGKKIGGQQGHKGSRLRIPPNLDELVKEGKAKKLTVDLTDGAREYVSRWKIDIETTVVYTEYRCIRGTKPGVYYGEKLKALSVLLYNNGLVAQGRISDLLREISFGQLRISEGSIERFNEEAAERIDLEPIKQELLNGETLHTDETPMRCAQRLEYGKETTEVAKGKSYEVTIRTHSNERATLYTVNPHKDDEGVRRDDILPRFHGILSHDHDKKYYKYGSRHATCGAHLLRELKGLYELNNIQWAEGFRRFYAGMNEYKNSGKACEGARLLAYEQTYDQLLSEGEAELNSPQPKAFGAAQLRAMLKRLREYKDEYLLFIRDYVAPFTNNQAERDLRTCKTKQKISGTFRSWNGVVCFAKIRSFLSTAGKQKLDLFGELMLLFLRNRSIAAE